MIQLLLNIIINSISIPLKYLLRKKEKQNFSFKEKATKYQLILDMDNTLIYSTINKLPNYNTHMRLLDKFYVYKRPHMDSFLDAVNKKFKFIY